MGLLFKFGQVVHEIFKFLNLQNMDFLDFLVRIYKWVLKIGMAPKYPTFFIFVETLIKKYLTLEWFGRF